MVNARIWNYKVGIQSSQFEYSIARQDIDIDVSTHGGNIKNCCRVYIGVFQLIV